MLGAETRLLHIP